MKSSSSSAELSWLEFESVVVLFGGEGDLYLSRTLSEKAYSVCRKPRFLARSKDFASAMTPLGPVLASKVVLFGMW